MDPCALSYVEDAGMSNHALQDLFWGRTADKMCTILVRKACEA
jgi:hypothetical protein